MFRTVCSLLLLVGTLAAAEPTPREQVLRLVPPESAVCFVVQNLRDQATTVANSPFAAWATQKLAPAIGKNADAQQILKVEEIITGMLGVSLKDLRDDIFGDCVAFAYEPGPAGQPGQERGVLILHARKPEKLQKLISKLNETQKSSGELTALNEFSHGGVTYFKRSRGTATPEFYLIHDHIFAFAVQEESLKGIVDRQAAGGNATVLKALDDLKLQSAFLACWLNPRKLDADLAAPTTASAAEKAGRAQMAKLWSAVDQCAFYLAATKDLEFGLSLNYRTADLPDELRPQFGQAPARSAIWSSIPDDAIFAVAADVELNALLKMIASFLPENERPALRQQIENAIAPIAGKEKVQAILNGIGPEVGVWAVKTPKDRGPLPAVTLASRVNKETDAFMRTVNFYAQLLQFDYNRNHNDQIVQSESAIDGLSLRTFTNAKLFPPNVQPTYSLIANYFVVGSDPESVKKFKAPVAGASAGDVPLARISGTKFREQIADHRDSFASFSAQHQDRDAAAIRGDLDNVASVLEAFEKVELVVRGDVRSRTFAVKVQLVKPLKD